MTFDMELLAVVTRRSDLFTAREAYATGTSPKMLHRAHRAGQCRQVLRGIYSTMPEPGRREERLRELTMAMMLSNDNAAATGRSAAAMYEWPLFGVNFKRAQGVWLNDNATRSNSSLIIRRPLVPMGVDDVDGWPVARPEWALIDLARDAGIVPGVVAMDAALHAGMVTCAAVEESLDQLRGSHRLNRARRMIDLADSARESAGESRLGIILQQAGFEVESQFALHRFWSGRRAFADFRINGTRVLIEFDGLTKYRGDEGAEALAQEKAREDELRSQGWVFVRVVWSDLAHPQDIIGRVRRALEMAHRTPSAL